MFSLRKCEDCISLHNNEEILSLAFKSVLCSLNQQINVHQKRGWGNVLLFIDNGGTRSTNMENNKLHTWNWGQYSSNFNSLFKFSLLFAQFLSFHCALQEPDASLASSMTSWQSLYPTIVGLS